MGECGHPGDHDRVILELVGLVVLIGLVAVGVVVVASVFLERKPK